MDLRDKHDESREHLILPRERSQVYSLARTRRKLTRLESSVCLAYE